MCVVWIHVVRCVCRYASCIDPMLEDEEQFADQLKEYYAFGESLR